MVDDIVGVIHPVGMVVIIQEGVATKLIVIENKLVEMVLRLVEVVVRVVIRLIFMLFGRILKLKLLIM